MFVHKVVDHAACGFWQVGIDIFCVAAVFHGSDHNHALFIGREQEALDAVFNCADGLAVAAVGVHNPQLHLAVDGVHECYLAASVDPHVARFTLGSLGQTFHVCAVKVHHIEVEIALVLLHAFVAHAVEQFFAVGGDYRSRHATECLKCGDVILAVCGGEVGFVDQLCVGGCGRCCHHHGCCCHND